MKDNKTKCKKVIKIIKIVYIVVSGFFSIMGLSFLLYFLGFWGYNNECDDDLTMERIQKSIEKNLSLSSVCMDDIRGFGNESIIVLADNVDEGDGIKNQFLIFDKVDNTILNQMHNFFGYGSNYKLSYSFSLKSENREWSRLGYRLKIINVFDFTGDMSKEIIVKFIPYGFEETLGYYETAIFSYSYEKHGYYLLGTYPSYNVEVPKDKAVYKRDSEIKNYYNEKEEFKLEAGYARIHQEFWADCEDSKYLVRAQRIWKDGESYGFVHQYAISVFEPFYNYNTKELEWFEVFSEETDFLTNHMTKERIFEYIEANDPELGNLKELSE